MDPERQTSAGALPLFAAHDQTLWGMLSSRAFDPARPLLPCGGRVCSYGEAIARIDELANSLHGQGIAQGGPTNCGCTFELPPITVFPPDEIKEALLHAAIYCGLPAANAAFHVAADELPIADALPAPSMKERTP
jgi:hypothetical protein